MSCYKRDSATTGIPSGRGRDRGTGVSGKEGQLLLFREGMKSGTRFLVLFKSFIFYYRNSLDI